MKLNEDRIARLANNIARYRNAATADQTMRGVTWYPNAHALAESLFGDARTGAGVIAALSPRMRWETNVRKAEDAAAGRTVTGLSKSVAKAVAIMAGSDPEDVLPMSAKTGHFYRNILDPTDPDAVTIDVWAHRAATDDPSSAGPANATDYMECVRAYQVIADETGEVANVTQAIVWNVVREGGMKS